MEGGFCSVQENVADRHRRNTDDVVVLFQALEGIAVLIGVMKIMNRGMHQRCGLSQKKQQDQYSFNGTLCFGVRVDVMTVGASHIIEIITL